MIITYLEIYGLTITSRLGSSVLN